MDLGLEGRTIIVTGGSAGIGAGTVQRLLREGANVVACARGAEALETTLEAVDPGGEHSLGVPLDVRHQDAASELVSAAHHRFGRLDGVVNNVGTSLHGRFEDMAETDWLEDLELKLFTARRLVVCSLPALRAQGRGAIVNVLSISAKVQRAGSMPTSVTRAAGLAMTKALSRELGSAGIRVNAVCVGLIRSRQHARRWRENAPELTEDAWYERLVEARGVPMGRAGQPDEVAATVALLLSDLSSFTTGTAINIDGGQAAVV